MGHLIEEKKALSAIRTAEEVKKDLNATAGWKYGDWATEKTEAQKFSTRILYDEEKEAFFSRSVRSSQKENEAFKAGLKQEGFEILDLEAQKQEPKNKLPVAIKDGKWSSSEEKEVSKAKKTFAHADLCTVREFEDLDEYINSDRKYLSFDMAVKDKNEDDKKAEFQQVISDIIGLNITSSMFTDDFLSQNMATLFDYSRKLQSIPAIKKKYPQYFSELSDETRLLIEAKTKVSSALSTVLTNHMILHGITCMPAGDGVKFVKIRDVNSGSHAKAVHRERQKKYDDSLKALRKKLTEDTSLDTAAAYAEGEQFSAETKLKDIEESAGSNPQMYVLFQDEYKTAYAEIKKAAVFRDELREQQKELLDKYAKATKESEKTELNAQIRLNNTRISVLSNHMDYYREFIRFLNGDQKDISADAADFLRAENATEEPGGIVVILDRIQRIKRRPAREEADKRSLSEHIRDLRITELKKAGVEIPEFPKKVVPKKVEKKVDPLPETDEEIEKLTVEELEDKMELLDRQGMGESDLYYKYWTRLGDLKDLEAKEEAKQRKAKKEAEEAKKEDKKEKPKPKKVEKPADPLPLSDDEIDALSLKDIREKIDYMQSIGFDESAPAIFDKYMNRYEILLEEEDLDQETEKKEETEEKKPVHPVEEEKEEEDDNGPFTPGQIDQLLEHIQHKKPVSPAVMLTFLELQVQGNLPKKLARAVKIANMDSEEELESKEEKEQKKPVASDADDDESIDDILSGKKKFEKGKKSKKDKKPEDDKGTSTSEEAEEETVSEVKEIPSSEEAISKMNLAELEEYSSMLLLTQKGKSELKDKYLARIKKLKDDIIAEEKKQREAEAKRIRENGGFTDKEVDELKKYLMGEGKIDLYLKERFVELYREDQLTKKLWDMVKLAALLNSDSPIWQELADYKKKEEKKEKKKEEEEVSDDTLQTAHKAGEIQDSEQPKEPLTETDGSVVLKIGQYEHQLTGTNCWCCSGIALIKQYMALSGNPLDARVDQIDFRNFRPEVHKTAKDIPAAVKAKLKKTDDELNQSFMDNAYEEQQFMGVGATSIGNVFEAADFFLEKADVRVNKMEIDVPGTESLRSKIASFKNVVFDENGKATFTLQGEDKKKYTFTVEKLQGEGLTIINPNAGVVDIDFQSKTENSFEVIYRLPPTEEEKKATAETYAAQKDAFVKQVKSVLATGNLVSILRDRHYRTIAGYNEQKGFRVLDSNQNPPDDDKWIALDELLEMKKEFSPIELVWLSKNDTAEKKQDDGSDEYPSAVVKEIAHNAYQLKGDVIDGSDVGVTGVDGVTTVSYVRKKEKKSA